MVRSERERDSRHLRICAGMRTILKVALRVALRKTLRKTEFLCRCLHHDMSHVPPSHVLSPA